MNKRSLTIFRLTAIAVFLVTMLQGCVRRPLEVILNEKVRVRLIINWRVNFQEIYGEIPEGMTVMLWGRNTGYWVMEPFDGNTATLMLQPDVYDVIIFNEYEGWFNSYNMHTYDKRSYADFTMRTDHYSTRAGEEDYMYPPQHIGVAVDVIEITHDMVELNDSILIPYEDYVDGGYENFIYSDRLIEFNELGYPMTVNLYLEMKVKRWQSIKSLQATISGMAEGFYMSRVNRTTTTGTLVLDPKNWTPEATRNAADSIAIIRNQTEAFGLPFGKELLQQRDSTDNVLHLRFTLTNDSVIDVRRNVGKLIKYLTPEGREAQIRYRQDLQNLKLVLDLSEVITLPPSDAKSGTGFDAEVADWVDGGIIPVTGM